MYVVMSVWSLLQTAQNVCSNECGLCYRQHRMYVVMSVWSLLQTAQNVCSNECVVLVTDNTECT